MQEVLTEEEVQEILEELRKIEQRNKDVNQNDKEEFLHEEN
ncbi:hypothetical protein SDD30_14135 [Moorella naiadis]